MYLVILLEKMITEEELQLECCDQMEFQTHHLQELFHKSIIDDQSSKGIVESKKESKLDVMDVEQTIPKESTEEHPSKTT